ncbi:hypothetical protein ABPG75_008196 [Micractinium tetrahymenae]
MDAAPPLQKAIEEGDLAGLISVLEDGRDINAPLHLLPERTPLEAAVSAGHLPLGTELLRQGADVRHRTTEDQDALMIAVQFGHHEMIEPLLQAGSAGLEELRAQPSPEKQRLIARLQGQPEAQLAAGGQTPLALAAMADQPACAKELLRLGARLDASCPCLGLTPVQHAVHSGSLATLKVLLDAGANLAARDASRQTLLHLAAQQPEAECSEAAGGCPRARCLRELFSRGCCLGLLDDRDSAGDTALATACRNGHAAVVEVLLKQGADPDAGTTSPLMLACSAGCPSAVELLLGRGARYVSGEEAPSPLMAALQPDPDKHGQPCPPSQQQLACARLLLERRATSPDELSGPAPGTALQFTPLLQLAPFSDCVEGARVLLEAGAAVDGLGNGPSAPLGAPLPLALKSGNLQLAQMLLERGASLVQRGALGETVLHSAMAAGPAAVRLVLSTMQQQLSRAQRLQLFRARKPRGQPPFNVAPSVEGSDPGGTALQLLIAAMQQDGLQVVDATGQLVIGPGGSISVSESAAAAAAAGAAATGSGAGASSGSASAAGAGSGRKKKAKSKVGPALSEYEITSQSEADAMQAAIAAGRQRQMVLVDDSDVTAARRAMQAILDARIAADPDSVYAVFDPAWRSLSPAAQLLRGRGAEGRRMLALLQPSSSLQAQTAALTFLQLAVCDEGLCKLLLKAGLARSLVGILGPKQAAARPLSWHLPLSSTLSHLFNVEPDVARQVWSSSALGGHILEFLRREFPGGGGQELPTGDKLHAAESYLALWCRAEGPEQAMRGWQRGPDAARLLVIQAVALLSHVPNLRQNALALITAVDAVQAAGVRSSLEDPALDFLNRSRQARRLFLDSPLLLTLADLLKASDIDGHTEMLLAKLGPLAGSCSAQLVQYGVPRYCLDLLSGAAQQAQQAQQPSPSMLEAAADCLLLLPTMAAGSPARGEEGGLWQAGMLAVTSRHLDALMAAAERGHRALAAAAPQAKVANELLKGALHVACKVEAERYLGEVRSLMLPAKALHLLGSAAEMLVGGAARDSVELWISLQRQLGSTCTVIVSHAGAKLAPALLEEGVLSTVAAVFPKTHFSVGGNLLSLFNLMVTIGRPISVRELRQQGVDRVLGLHGPNDPAWLAARPLSPLQRLIWHVMSAIENGPGDPKFGLLTLSTLRAVGAALRGNPLRVDPAAATAEYCVEAPFSEEAEGLRCACCGALGGAAGINLRKCSGCKAVSFCGSACQLRNWKLEHKAVCSSRRQAAAGSEAAG